MVRNIGGADKITRLVIAAAIAVLYFTNVINGTSGLILLIIAIILVITTFTGYCLLYKLLGVDTCSRKGKKEE